MRRPVIQGLAAAAAWVATSSAGASVTTGITVSDFRVQVAALAPGATAAVSFASTVGSVAECESSVGNPSTDQERWFSSGRAFGQAVTATAVDPAAGSSAAISGNVFGAGVFIDTWAHASSLVPLSSAEGMIGLVNGVSTASFTLAPWTFMTISARVVATASSTGANPFEFADSGMLMAIGDDQGTGPQFAYVNFNAFAFGGLGAIDDRETAFLSLTYENASDAAIHGLFSGYVASAASSGSPVSAVPEPASLALLASGVAALALLSRRRHGRN